MSQSAVNEFSAFVDAFHKHMLDDANECVYLGVDQRRDELPDRSAAAAAAVIEEASGLLSRIATIDRQGLNFDQNLDLDLAALILESRIHNRTYTFNGRTRLQQLPRAADDISAGMFFFFINDPRPDRERLGNVTARMQKVPAYLDSLLERLDTPVARWVDIDLDKVGGLPDFFSNLSAWAKRVEFAERADLDRAIGEANRAMASYRDKLRAMPTTRNFHLGMDATRRIVALRGIELSLEELHGIARDFLAENTASVEAMRQTLARKYKLPADITAEALQRHLNAHYAVAREGTDLELILDEYRAERDKILAFVKERDLFPVPDAQDMKILRTPAFMAPSIPAGAMESPPPFREGVRTSLVYLTLAEDLRTEHSRLSIPGMMIHEGIPGHHLQLATASMHSSIVRRHANATEHCEGWTTMLEDYMLDIGYMGDLTDECRFIGKRDIARIGARVAIDLFFMTGERSFLDVGVDCDISPDDPFEAAGNLLAAVTGFVPQRVQSELNWYSQERGYPLSYLTGNRLVWQLKRDLAEARAASADAALGEADKLTLDRQFHKLYLESGNMPLSFLRRVMQHRGLLAA